MGTGKSPGTQVCTVVGDVVEAHYRKEADWT
jgi:hypothetical protein